MSLWNSHQQRVQRGSSRQTPSGIGGARMHLSLPAEARCSMKESEPTTEGPGRFRIRAAIDVALFREPFGNRSAPFLRTAREPSGTCRENRSGPVSRIVQQTTRHCCENRSRTVGDLFVENRLGTVVALFREPFGNRVGPVSRTDRELFRDLFREPFRNPPCQRRMICSYNNP